MTDKSTTELKPISEMTASEIADMMENGCVKIENVAPMYVRAIELLRKMPCSAEEAIAAWNNRRSAAHGGPISNDARFMAALDGYMDAVTADPRNTDRRINQRLEIFAAAEAWHAAAHGDQSKLTEIGRMLHQAEKAFAGIQAGSAEQVSERAEKLIKDINELTRLADNMGRSRGQNNYCNNRVALDKFVDLKISLEARIRAALQSAPEIIPQLPFQKWAEDRGLSVSVDAAPERKVMTDAGNHGWRAAYSKWVKQPLPDGFDLNDIPAAMWAAFYGGFHAAQATATNTGEQTAPEGCVIVPDAEHMTDEQAEAIAKVANCCGGIAYDIYRAAIEAAPSTAQKDGCKS